ncbi:mitosis inhibitor protein kinase swe1 [Marasmius tenuissimus]|uniref:Mitosis inhibitor protein kinase swe1 n=1 Tax=Marasmius tenuissimus TaxID=585030 RepID=A0ABR3A692_9AGAR
MSPSCRSQSSNRRKPASSPFRQRHLFGSQPQQGGPFSKSPMKLSVPPPDFSRFPSTSRPWSYAAEEDEDAVFLESPTASRSMPLPIITSPPLLTPIKRSSGHFDELNQSAILDSPSSIQHISHPGGGVKRKPYRQSTPLRKHSLTPLNITSELSNRPGVQPMDRLAPLPLPTFNARTPQSKSADYQRTSMNRLRITDLNDSDEDVHAAHDSGLDLGEDEEGDALFLGSDSPPNAKVTYRKPLRMKGRGKILKESDEVAEAISPGGHVTKRRARARPLSDELLESVRVPASAAKPTIAFPKHTRSSSSGSESSEMISPVPRRRVSGLHSPQPSAAEALKRAPLARVDSATFFFGPPVQSSPPAPPPRRTRVSTSVSSPNAAASPSISPSHRPRMVNRHSFSGSGSLSVWAEIQARAEALSPQSSPPGIPFGTENDLTDEDDHMMIDDIPANSSFNFSVSETTPSPRRQSDMISKKYKARDSGIALSDDDSSMDIFADPPAESSMPRASTSVSSLYSDGEDGLVTPGAGPRLGSGWPEAVIVTGGDDPYAFLSSTSKNGQEDVDSFILRTLAAAAKAPVEEKKAPGTPVKKTKISYMSGARPWQSAVTHKVGLAQREENLKKSKAPRKSLPAMFPSLGRRGSSRSLLDSATDSEDDSDDSPSMGKDRYAGLGLGRPAFPAQVGKNGIARTRWLTRRTSSGAFSSGSDSLSTPTRNQGYHPVQFSPSKNRFKPSPARSASGSSSNSSLATLNSPTTARRNLPINSNRASGRLSEGGLLPPSTSTFTRQSRFERDFVEVAEIGSGEFGKVIKAKLRGSENNECYAIKKSKRFEGARHRLRLKEEVEILQHLVDENARHRHPNVLAFVDSWEEDEQLWICTELCDLGNFARFLWEYGRAFPRLDEARVWKIIADLSNGLRFIHDSGVIHLDLKPANIFVTGEGRFKIGDFGMASLWPRQRTASTLAIGTFEREGDKLYLAPEVLQGTYGKAADVFSFGMTILETASNIVVPDQGEAWHSLRREDFSQVDLDESPELLLLIRGMMRTDPAQRLRIEEVWGHPVVARARRKMEEMYSMAMKNGTPVFAASPLASVSAGFLEEILDI